jgi:hypothetical protein
MKDQIVMLLLGLLIALGGWTMTQTFSLSTTQAVHTDKLDKLERATDKLREQMDEMLKVDEEIMEQHENLFDALRSNQPSSSYNY